MIIWSLGNTLWRVSGPSHPRIGAFIKWIWPVNGDSTKKLVISCSFPNVLIMPTFHFWQLLWLGKMALRVWKWAQLSFLLSSVSQTSLAQKQGQVHSHGENDSSLSFDSRPERMVLTSVACHWGRWNNCVERCRGPVSGDTCWTWFRSTVEAPGDHLTLTDPRVSAGLVSPRMKIPTNEDPKFQWAVLWIQKFL